MAVAASADLASLAADLAYASRQGMMQTAQDIIRQAAQQIKDEAQTRAPIKSGRLKNSITVRYTGPLSAVIGPNTFYASFMEYGTGTRGEFPGPMYEIRPRNARVLAFTIDGRKVFARKVNHPGVTARPYMRPAFEAVLGRDLVAKLADAGAAAITRGPNA